MAGVAREAGRKSGNSHERSEDVKQEMQPYTRAYVHIESVRVAWYISRRH